MLASASASPTLLFLAVSRMGVSHVVMATRPTISTGDRGCIKAVLNGNGTNRLCPYVSADGTSIGTTTSSAAVASSTSTATCESSGHSEKRTSSRGQTVAMVTSIRPFFYVDDDFLDEVQTRKSAANARTTDAGTGTSIAG
ncbi:hypothetical protein IWX46DRAFT_14931 [Phyllosticta citricarpa]|uniref:Secreted protein n=1 Tax=Phyllosticta citricarpa TaxID=55181 RepID=A0ABR1MTQ7_9PEZI